MTKLAWILLLLSFHLYAAQKHMGTIEYIDEAKTPDEVTHLYLSDGYVLKVTESLAGVDDYQDAMKKKFVMEFSVDEDRHILAASVITIKNNGTFDSEHGLSYEPTVLSSVEEAQAIFNNLRRGAFSWSQCYNRAHIWSYESKERYNLDSMKMFIFYTRRYIRNYDFNWWFHVAPFTYAKDGGEKKELILDRSYAKGPLKVKSWTDLFMRNKANCPVISKYSDYEDHQETEDCYLYKASMFYLQPLDLENLELRGTQKTKWLNYEVSRAYWNAFGM